MKVVVRWMNDEIEFIDTDEEKLNIDIESENGLKNGKKKKERRIRRKPLLLAFVVTIILAYATSFSWYKYNRENHGETKDLDIMTPYFLYLMNPDESTSLQFTVGNIHPGEVKQIIICVSNKRPVDVTDFSIDIARESEFNYDLEFIYTENLAVNYDIYELNKSTYENESDIPEEGIVIEGVDGSYWTKMTSDPDALDIVPLSPTKDETETRLNEVFPLGYDGVYNKGKYLMYQQDSKGDPLGLKYENEEYEFDYYLVEISWKDNVSFSEYTKETDVMYVVVNAKQPKPVEKQ